MAASPRISPTKSIKSSKTAESIHLLHFIVVGVAHSQAAHSHRRHRCRCKLLTRILHRIRHVRSPSFPPYPQHVVHFSGCLFAEVKARIEHALSRFAGPIPTHQSSQSPLEVPLELRRHFVAQQSGSGAQSSPVRPLLIQAVRVPGRRLAPLRHSLRLSPHSHAPNDRGSGV